MSKKRILYIGNKLSKHGFTITVMETLGLLLEREGFDVFYASDKKNKFLRMFDMIIKTLRFGFKTDYVLIDTYSTSNFYYSLLISQLCRLLNLKYIPILHGGNLPKRLESNSFFSNILFKNAYKNVAPSQYLLTSFLKKGYSNTIYIPNTIHIENYPFYSREIKGPKLLWVRSFAKIYNPKMAIKVLSLLKKDFQNATLTMVGPDKENILPECKEFAKSLGVEVTFTGKLTKQDWLELSKSKTIFINTTHFDNTPVSVIEAMALGLPIVSTNVGGLPFLIQNDKHGILVNDDDAEEMSNAIKKIILNPNYTFDLIKNARQETEKFDWNIVRLLWLELLA
ncbi:MAG: glycosyltransferase family 4 protein [Flavobacterium sp.]